MNNKFYHILPVFTYRVWGSDALIKKYGYESDLPNIGECYNVIAMPGHLDCDVAETGEKLSAFYHTHKELFDCEKAEMPVRAAMACTSDCMSVQVHPNDEYALAHDGRLGKPDGVYFIETGEGATMELGHYAKTHEEFEEKVKDGKWDELLRYIPIAAEQFVDVPFGTLHAFGAGLTLIEFTQNADLTYRLYDYNRIDPVLGTERELHTQKVLECVNVPNSEINLVDLKPVEKDGCIVTVFHSEAKVYSAGRIQVKEKGVYERDEFYFVVGINGEGTLDGMPFKAGETILVPAHHGPLTIEGDLDLTYVTYEA